ncbi:hypothetical protein WN48_09335 [Eufriesea mexicana]|nr:hypothetical protein WN48_09335 [Eufriesea mexicana]
MLRCIRYEIQGTKRKKKDQKNEIMERATFPAVKNESSEHVMRDRYRNERQW